MACTSWSEGFGADDRGVVGAGENAHWKGRGRVESIGLLQFPWAGGHLGRGCLQVTVMRQPGIVCGKTDVLAAGDFYSLLEKQEGLIAELQGRSATISWVFWTPDVYCLRKRPGSIRHLSEERWQAGLDGFERQKGLDSEGWRRQAWCRPARFILALINKNMSRASLQNYLQENFKLWALSRLSTGC